MPATLCEHGKALKAQNNSLIQPQMTWFTLFS